MRSFESSGPDVKIRGTPSHIAEKYITLARDALSSGDPVLAENYLQHAGHYNRIILGYREQMAQQGGGDPMGMGNGAARTHSLAGPEGSDGDEFGEEISWSSGRVSVTRIWRSSHPTWAGRSRSWSARVEILERTLPVTEERLELSPEASAMKTLGRTIPCV